MARLTSRASVLGQPLTSLQGPAARRPGWPRPGMPRRLGRWPGPRQAAARRGPLGYDIWDSARRQAEFYGAAYAETLETSRRPRRGEEWVQETYPGRHWIGPAALASSYRLAAQHAASWTHAGRPG